MSILVKKFDPIEIIKKSSTARDPSLVNQFIEVIERIYQYELFKPMMDLSSTLCFESRLQFIIEPKEFYMLDEGNCVTIEAFGNTKKKYRITIRKIKADVIIHEIGHMIEKESDTSLDTSFNKAIVADIKNLKTGNISLQSAINDIMISQVAPYPNSQKGSELFTRYFQLLSMSKEVAGFAAEYGYTIAEVYKAFPLLEAWLWDHFYSSMIAKINIDIAKNSTNYIKPISDIKHKWAGEKVTSSHAGRPQPKWSANVKSIKDDK